MKSPLWISGYKGKTPLHTFAEGGRNSAVHKSLTCDTLYSCCYLLHAANCCLNYCLIWNFCCFCSSANRAGCRMVRYAFMVQQQGYHSTYISSSSGHIKMTTVRDILLRCSSSLQLVRRDECVGSDAESICLHDDTAEKSENSSRIDMYLCVCGFNKMCIASNCLTSSKILRNENGPDLKFSVHSSHVSASQGVYIDYKSFIALVACCCLSTAFVDWFQFFWWQSFQKASSLDLIFPSLN